MKLLELHLVLAVALAATACFDDEPIDDGDGVMLTLEEGAVTEALDDANASPAHVLDTSFRRLGLMWDAPAANALEVRASGDGHTWTAWRAVSVTSEEDGARTGFVDFEHSYRQIQYRIPDMAMAPTFVAFEPLAEIPVVDDALDLEVDEPEIGSTEQALTTKIGNVKIHSRTSWRARRPRCTSRHTPTRATIHHTVTPTRDSMSPQARLRQIQSYHMNVRGWCDIGYQYLISRDGRVWRGRGARQLGAHVANANTGNVGISFMGNYTSTKATKKQRCNAAKLLRGLHQRYPGLKLNRTDVKGHRQFGGTACPGTQLYKQVGNIVTMSRKGC